VPTVRTGGCAKPRKPTADQTAAGGPRSADTDLPLGALRTVPAALDTGRRERLCQIASQIEDAELSGRAADAVADLLAGVKIESLDLQQRRCLLAQLDFRMEPACEDWGAKSRARRYEATSRWAGEALLGSAVTRDYALSPKARVGPEVMEARG
jgi:hypothetical protein